MARSAVSEEEIQLRKRARRRLVGAVALALLVVAAVPMILDSEPRQPPHRIEVQVPPVPQRPLTPDLPPAARESATAAPAAQQPSISSDAPRAAASPPPAPDTTTFAPRDVAPAAPAQAPTPSTEPRSAAPQPAKSSPATASPAPQPAAASNAAVRAEKPAPGAERYAVALIATSSASKAASLKRELQRLKYPAYTQRTPDGDKTRVRVGPYASREAAEQARLRLIRQGFDPGKVVRQGD